MASNDRSASTRSHRTALLSSKPLGSAEITHPFHPLRGQRFVVLKVRHVSGVAILSMRHAELGSFAVPQEWTDRAAHIAEPGEHALIVDAFALADLAAIVDFMTRDQAGD